MMKITAYLWLRLESTLLVLADKRLDSFAFIIGYTFEELSSQTLVPQNGFQTRRILVDVFPKKGEIACFRHP
jgi:hypothetical protein